jgi:hypothetical protein
MSDCKVWSLSTPGDKNVFYVVFSPLPNRTIKESSEHELCFSSENSSS